MTATIVNQLEASSLQHPIGSAYGGSYTVFFSSNGLTEQDSGTFVSRSSVVYERFKTKLGDVFFPIADLHGDKTITRDEVKNIPGELEDLVSQVYHRA